MKDDDILTAVMQFERSAASVWIYGSRAANMGTTGSDLDVLVFVPDIENTYRVDEIIDDIPVSLNFFGPASIYQVEVQRNEGLYFVTRFLSPTRLVYSSPLAGAEIEKDAFKSIIYWLSEAFEDYTQGCESNPELLLRLCYLFKISMNISYLPYFSALFHSDHFSAFWNCKLKLLEEVIKLKHAKLPNRMPDDFEKRLLRGELSVNFWIFSQNIRNGDSNHVKLYHEKVRRKYSEHRQAARDAVAFLELPLLAGR